RVGRDLPGDLHEGALADRRGQRRGRLLGAFRVIGGAGHQRSFPGAGAPHSMDAFSAAASRSGSSDISSSRPAMTLGTDTDAAATTPRGPLIGAAMQLMKSSCSPLSTA